MIDEAKTAVIVGVARGGGIDPAALLAVVEIESRGEPFEADGDTPRFLFEKHHFYRQLQKNAPESSLQRARSMGLAVPNFSKANYQNQRTSEGRRRILQNARAINEECANRACSWGIGQIMGFNAASLGYSSATDMVRQFSASGQGFQAQVDGMLRFIQKNGLANLLAKKDWTAFALRYNGPAQKQNRYDQKLREAYQRWSSRTLPPADYVPPSVDPLRRAKEIATARLAPGSSSEDVREVQQKLTDAGYALGKIDGDYGSKTEAAVFAFQTANNLRATGIVDDVTFAKLNSPAAMPIANARRNASQTDLLRLGSRTIKETRFGKILASILGIAGGGGLADSVYRAQNGQSEGTLEYYGNQAALIGDKISGVTPARKVPDVSTSVAELNRIVDQLRNYADEGGRLLSGTDGNVQAISANIQAIRTSAANLAGSAEKLKSVSALAGQVKNFVHGKGGLVSNLEDAGRRVTELQSGVKELVMNKGDFPDVGELLTRLSNLKGTLGSLDPAAVNDGVLGSVLKSGLLMLSPTNGLPVVALGVGLLMLRSFSAVRKLRVEDHQKGFNLGR